MDDRRDPMRDPAGRSRSTASRRADWLRIAELVAHYRDLPLGTVDASVMAAAERLAITEVATLDRRHFTVIQATNGPLNLLL